MVSPSYHPESSTDRFAGLFRRVMLIGLLDACCCLGDGIEWTAPILSLSGLLERETSIYGRRVTLTVGSIGGS